MIKNHLSNAKCHDFIYRNIGPGSEYVYLHGHVDEKDAEWKEDHQGMRYTENRGRAGRVAERSLSLPTHQPHAVACDG